MRKSDPVSGKTNSNSERSAEERMRRGTRHVETGPFERTNEYNGYTPPKRGISVIYGSLILFLLSWGLWYQLRTYGLLNLTALTGAVAFGSLWRHIEHRWP